jgi:limonene-1,2-epoxide hydrolase
MSTSPDLDGLAVRFLAAWTSQDVERVVACYAPTLSYSDPNTRGPIRTADELRRYLRKLFAAWTMTWSKREVHALAPVPGAAVLWRATFQRRQGGEVVDIDGMDLVELDGERIVRNEVYFDRSRLPA